MSRIRKIKEITSDKLLKVWFPVFTVIREDGNPWIFSEVDFDIIEQKDLEDIAHHIKRKTIRPFEMVKALDIIKRYFKSKVILSSITDLQIAIESSQPKVNLLKPDQDLIDIEKFAFGTALDNPELGVIFKNSKGEKKFLCASQVERYCDGTLDIIKIDLKDKIQLNDNTSRFIEPREIIAAREVLKMIEDRLAFREGIRRLEKFLGLRKKSA